MNLTRENIADWKKAFDKLMYDNMRLSDYSTTITDEEWLKKYNGVSATDAVADEITSIQEHY